ncbi:MAG: lipopolysaccharide biosynthesis protein [Gammaproteobacteria bacterium]|nr:lipopolysaccharide biosynthesis protein [Gammaproteobacteria bacterium]
MPNNTRKRNLLQHAFVLRSDKLGQKVLYGVSFTFLGVFLRTVLTIGSTAMLARLLTPVDFGLIAMTAVVTEFAVLFGNFGFGSVLIQRRRITRIQIDTVFWASILLGSAITVAIFLSSFVASSFFKEEVIGELLRVLCLIFLLTNITVIHNVILTRTMGFRTIFWIEIISIFIRLSIAVFFAWEGYGVWSFVAGAFAGVISKILFSQVFVRYWPRLRFNLVYLRTTWKTSASYFGGGFLFYANTTFDLLLIGRMLGAAALGFYQNSRSLTDEVRYRIAVPLQRVLFPAFSSQQNELLHLQNSVRRSGRLLSCVVIPIGFGISATSQEIVPILYGQKWLDMIPILTFLGINTAIRACASLSMPIFYSMNHVSINFKYNAVITAITLIMIIAAVPMGIVAVSAAVAISSVLSIVVYWKSVKLLDISFVSFLSMFLPPLIASILMWLLIFLLRYMLRDFDIATGIIFSILVMVGAFIYSALLILFSPKIYNEFKDVIYKLIH